jgi:serine/threonine protein kinase/WD40 repeat protein
MNPEPDPVESLFALVLGKPAAERAAYLDQACAGDAALRQRIEALLKAHAEASGEAFLTGPYQPASIVDAATEGPGTRIGPYKLLQQIGEGGMGVVYMAEQEQPVRRRVALKIIRPGMDSAHIIARFEAERQALAMMDHQNIARVLDAGTTPSGRPYFVMELVHGVPITRFCDDNKLTPRERLELFVPVCQAIQHAHQKGIIHRDVKPSNVLVTMYDDKPVPKVIDFGVAKAIEQRLTDKTLFTQFGTLVGTFEYMSPEQAEMNAFGVDTRSDVYSLGVLMYELLTGTTPLERERLRRAAFDEVVRLIKLEEAPRPSTRLSSSGNLAKIAAARKTDPARLTRLVRGELDWIVMRCLEKNRSRRYESASALARDVERYLHDEPVEACPPSVGYRLKKFGRKNRGLLTTAGAFVALLLVAVGVSSWLAVEARTAKSEADVKRGEAEQAGKAASEAGGRATQEWQRAEDALTQLKMSAAETRRALDRMTVAKGIQLADEGRLFTALPWLVKPFEQNGLTPEEEKGHRTRLASYLRHWPGRPTLRHMLFHEDAVTHAAFTADAKRVLTVSGQTVQVWDLKRGELLVTLRHPDLVSTAQFSADDKLVLTVAGSAVWTWDAHNGQSMGPPLLDWVPLLQPLLLSLPHSSAAIWNAIAIQQLINSSKIKIDLSCHGQYVLTQHEKLLQILDIRHKKLVTQWMCDETKHDNAYALSPDGRNLLITRDGKPCVQDTSTAAINALSTNDESRVISVAFSQDGTRALTLSKQKACVWDTNTWRIVTEFDRREQDGEYCMFSPDNRFIAISPWGDRTSRNLACWDLALHRWVRFVSNMTVPERFIFDWQPTGHQLVQASEYGDVKIWDASTGRLSAPMFSLSSPASAVAYSPDGRTLLTASDDGVTLIWDLCQEQNYTISTVPMNDISTIEIASYRPVQVPFFNIPFPAYIEWQTVSGSRSIKLPDCAAFERLITSAVPIAAAAFSSDRTRLIALQSKAANDDSGTPELKIFDTKTGQQQGKALKLNSGFTNCIAISPDNRWVAVAEGSSVRLVDAKTAEPAGELLKHDGTVFHIAFSMDGEMLVSCSGDRKARLWRPKTGERVGKDLEHGGIVAWADVSPTHQIIATAAQDGQVRLWDTSGSLIGVLPAVGTGHRVAFQPNGSFLLVAASNMGTIWDINSLQQVTPPFAFHSTRETIVMTEAIRFSKDGKSLLDLDRVICDLTPDHRPADDLIKLAHLYSRHRLVAGDGLLPLSKQELQRLWQELHAKYPAEFAVSPRAVVEWRIKQLQSMSGGQDSFGIASSRRWLNSELTQASWQPGEHGNEDMNRNNYLERLYAVAQHGSHSDAVAAADALALRYSKDGDTLYNCACIYGLAAGAVKADAPLADRYALRAIALLRQAADAGFKDSAHLQKDTDLDSLRTREDFKALVKQRFSLPK